MTFEFSAGATPQLHQTAELRMKKPFDSVLIANRGEIAVRIIRTLRTMGIKSIAVYSDPDKDALHVQLADQAVRIGPAAAAKSYLNIDAVVQAAVKAGAEAVHPGYGFLSENSRFAQALAENGIVFIGPSTHALAVMGDKITAKNHVAASGVPTVPGYAGEPGQAPTDEQLRAHAADVGYPLLIKPSAGGGGKGMVVVEREAELSSALATARRIAASAFGDDTLFLERLVRNPRHIEVQILADNHGNVVHLGERECSLQRRHQKVIEEAPSALLEGLPHGADIRERMGQAACDAARSVDYSGAGTIEFLVSDDNPDDFFFMEMNTRLQVEHPVTEEVTGIDLVEQQILLAAGRELSLTQEQIRLSGHAMEARIYAEDPRHGFLPASGTILFLEENRADEPGSRAYPARIDSSLFRGQVIGSDYDPMLAKVIAVGEDRGEALDRLDAALARFCVLGVTTNVSYLRLLLADPEVQAGRLDTGLIERKLESLAFAEPDDMDLLVAAAQCDLAFGSVPSGVLGRGRIPTEINAEQLWAADDGWRVGTNTGRSLVLQSGETVHRIQIWGTRHDPGFPEPTELSPTGLNSAGLSSTGLNPTGLNLTLALEKPEPGERVQLRLELAPYGHFEATLGDEKRRYAIAASTVSELPERSRSTLIWLGREGTSTEFALLGREEALAKSLASLTVESGTVDPRIITPMPGTVVAVLVQDGQQVREGEHLLSVEAMKMEHQLSAPISGTVRLHVRAGEQVSNKAVLATIHPDTPQTPATEPENPATAGPQ